MYECKEKIADVSLKSKFDLENIIMLHQEQSKEASKIAINKLLEEEALEFIGVKRKHEPSRLRRGYLHGNYERNLETKIGILTIRRQKVRVTSGSERYRSSIVPNYRRRTDEIVENILMIYFLGASTRKSVSELQKLFGLTLSASGISKVLKVIEKKADEFHSRKLQKQYKILWIDGMYSTVRNKGKNVLLLVYGEDSEGRQELVDYRVADSENETNYEIFLNDLYRRGLEGAKIVIHDGHLGLSSAVRTVYPEIKQQVCIFHKKKDIRNKVSEKHRKDLMKDVSEIYSSASKHEAMEIRNKIIKKWINKEPRAVRSLCYGFEKTLTYLEMEVTIRKRVRTNNPLERFIQEIRRRTVPMRYFQNMNSFNRLIFGIICILNINRNTGIYQRFNLYFHLN